MASEPERDPQLSGAVDSPLFKWVFASIVFILFVADLALSNTTLGVASLFFVPAWILLTVVHEGAHALAARLMKWQVPSLDVGFGRIWRQFKVGQTEVSLRQYPLIGCVHIVPTHFRQPRLRNALIYAAGPLSEAAIVLLLVSLCGVDTLISPSNLVEGVLGVTCLAGALSVALNLFPIRLDNGAVTDGLGILTSASLPTEHFEALFCEPILSALVQSRKEGELERCLAGLTELAEHFPRVIDVQYEIACTLVLLGRRSEGLFGFQAFVSTLGQQQREAAKVYAARLRAFPNEIEEPYSWHEH